MHLGAGPLNPENMLMDYLVELHSLYSVPFLGRIGQPNSASCGGYGAECQQPMQEWLITGWEDRSVVVPCF